MVAGLLSKGSSDLKETCEQHLFNFRATSTYSPFPPVPDQPNHKEKREKLSWRRV